MTRRVLVVKHVVNPWIKAFLGKKNNNILGCFSRRVTVYCYCEIAIVAGIPLLNLKQMNYLAVIMAEGEKSEK